MFNLPKSAVADPDRGLAPLSLPNVRQARESSRSRSAGTSPDKRGAASQHMHHGTSGKVQIPPLSEPAVRDPDPMRHDGF
jgi:hypothetical protein